MSGEQDEEDLSVPLMIYRDCLLREGSTQGRCNSKCESNGLPDAILVRPWKHARLPQGFTRRF